MLSEAIKWTTRPKKSTGGSFFSTVEECGKSLLPRRQYDLGQRNSRDPRKRAAVDAARGGQKVTTTGNAIWGALVFQAQEAKFHFHDQKTICFAQREISARSGVANNNYYLE